ncbi:hypothetical protein PHYSODRAFT_480233 [Phytophthora sojae]|uniref:Uncharacterized protein n=1 Tax=Phytophthora sojae (strain P6497) TaxID=1094619 RepID=G4Z1H4_PHYSP|nr:hypothetical protein PHYSODRAFT_480233 [Phytophthora sojae]EGZ25885.1 hypothetical protein PHYSODRAFT_480233 [Phytophthora sojae]|eukprot:XP_009521173.1 hypothetical protein PHYSODRAFT_480233 [Phytophthora sojae]
MQPQLAIQWISTRGAWLLDSLTKAFAYVGTTTREDQSVGKVLAGYRDPHLPCVTPTIATLSELLPALEYAQLLTLRGQLFKNVSGFTDTTLNVDALVLDAALASLLIHLDDVATALWHTATQKKQQFVRADLKVGVNIMIIAAGREVDVPTAPLDRDGVAYRLWKQRVWTLAEDLDKKVNAALGSIDGKGRSKTAGRYGSAGESCALTTALRTTRSAQHLSPAKRTVASSTAAHQLVTNGSKKTWSRRITQLVLTLNTFLFIQHGQSNSRRKCTRHRHPTT